MKPKRTRPETTLLLNLSVDGRLTSHDSDTYDPDKTWKHHPQIASILQQFYEFNQPQMVALTTGVIMKNLGVNQASAPITPSPFSLVVLDPDKDLTPKGIHYLTQNVKRLYYVSLNHQSISPQPKNFLPIYYDQTIDLNHLFQKLYQTHRVNKLFIQSIAPLNASLFDANLIDHLSVIISPLLVGDRGIPPLFRSPQFITRRLKLIATQKFSQNYINLRYDVVTT